MTLEAVHIPAKSAGPYHARLPFLCSFLLFSYLPFAQLSPLHSGLAVLGLVLVTVRAWCAGQVKPGWSLMPKLLIPH